MATEEKDMDDEESNANQIDLIPVSIFAQAVKAFEAVRPFIYATNSTEKDKKISASF